MTKCLFFLLGVIVGLLFAGIGVRKKLEHLKTFEVDKAEQAARYGEYERERKEQIAAMPFERRMEWELFEATLKAHNYQHLKFSNVKPEGWIILGRFHESPHVF